MNKPLVPSVRILIVGMLCLGTLLAYWPVRNFDFINLDDGEYVCDNPHVTSGVTLENILWAFTEYHSANWHPLTWISHMIDCRLYGLEAGGHHLTNLFIHIINSALLFFIMRLMTGALWRSALVAALFALHPQHVESVAWVSERKDVLSTFFLLLTLWAYFRYSQRPGFKRYAIVACALTAGLMAKPMLVTTPILLLVLDFWPLRRFTGQPADRLRGLPFAARATSRTPVGLFIEKIPLFLLSFAACAVTMLAQKSDHAVWSPLLIDKIATIITGYASYLASMIIPKDLCLVYPFRHSKDVPLFDLTASALFFLLAWYAAIRTWRRFPWLGAGWLWYVCSLVPVIGIVQVGMQWKADRYTYIPLIGAFIVIAWGIHALSERFPRMKTGLIVLACMAIAAFSLLTRHQVGYWKNDIVLNMHALESNPDNYKIHNNLGLDYYRIARMKEAESHFKACFRSSVRQRYSSADFNLGILYAKTGDHKRAVRHFKEAVRSDSTEPTAYLHLVALSNETRDDSSVTFLLSRLQTVLTARILQYPRDNNSLMQLSLVLIERDSLESAIGYLTRLKREAPRQWMPPYLLGFSWKKRGDFQRAFINYLESMERCGAASFEPYFGMGVLLFQKGKLHSAKSLFTRSISIDPLRAEAYFNRASISLLQNKPDSALRDFRAALRLKPGMGAAHERLAGIFAAKGIEDSAAFHRRQAGSAGSGKDVGILEEKNNFSRFTAPF